MWWDFIRVQPPQPKLTASLHPYFFIDTYSFLLSDLYRTPTCFRELHH